MEEKQIFGKKNLQQIRNKGVATLRAGRGGPFSEFRRNLKIQRVSEARPREAQERKVRGRKRCPAPR